MARAFAQTSRSDYEQEPRPGEWQALRGELVALLDQVEGQVARAHRADTGYQALSERMRDLRFQVAEQADPEAPDRRTEALRSVQRAVNRFSDRDERIAGHGDAASMPVNPRDTLQAAIHQIRARRIEEPLPMPAGLPMESPLLGELAHAVTGISGRLERLEVELKAQARNNGSVRDIAEQVAQLSHVVELLAGAVGETGQVKRLEAQLANLSKMVAQGPQIDFSALTKRLDDVSATVGRLADLQVQYVSRVENPVQTTAFKDGMQSIEASVRNVYDRIDAIERTAVVSPADIDHLTSEMARFTEAMRSSATPPANLIQLLDALNGRVSDIENQEGVISALRGDIATLRGAVTSAMEPRFSAIETQIETLSDRLAQRHDDISIAPLEAQVRQLVARMDQTGAQLSDLARLYSQPQETSAGPDLEGLAELVAARTSEAMAQQPMPAATPGITDQSLLDLEGRIGRLFRSTQEEQRPVEDFSQMRNGISEVNERLARLEASLMKARSESAIETNAPVQDAPPAMPVARAAERELPAPPVAGKVTTSVVAASQQALRDSMPRSPAEDAPLIAPAFPEASPVQAALEVKNGPRKRHPGLEADGPMLTELESMSASQPATAPRSAARPEFDPTTVTRPAAPVPTLGLADELAFGPSTPAEAAESSTPASPSSRNTFIEAARRAAQRQAPGKVEANSNSLIGRALARFQGGAAAEPTTGKQAKPQKQPKSRQLAGDKTPRTEWKPEPAEPAPPVAPTPTVLSPEDATAAPGGGKLNAEPASESFLSRHRKPILLAASIVALSFLTLNLIVQRMEPGKSEAPAPAIVPPAGDISPTATEAQPADKVSSLSTAPRVIPMVDSLATGSIDPAAAHSFAPAAPAPDMPASFKAVTDIASGSNSELAPPLSAPSESPVKVELPPESLGPIELRQAAADGEARAQFEIAAIYTEGRAVKQDFKAAATWFERTAAQGFAPSQYRLGSLYENGNGVPKDLTQAKLWYQRAAEAGNRMSMHNLAALYAGGQLGKQEFESAAKWFEEAASRGLTDSQFNLGMLYARGLGVPQSLEQSYKWFALAATSGDKDAAKSRDDIARSLGADSVNKLAAEVAAWKPVEIDLAANFAPIGTWSKKFDPGETIKTRDIVASVQEVLTKLGFDVGTADGVPGPKTAEAIKAFERATGMSEVGAINPRLLAVLGSQPV